MAIRNLSEQGVNIGVDIGKFKLDFHIYERELHWQADNTPEGIKQSLTRINRYKVERLVVEATGRYELALVDSAFDKGLPVVVVQPLQVRRYAGAINQLAKTDKIDAAVIAEFGARVKPRVSQVQGKNIRVIKDLIARRRQLIDLLVQEKNRSQIMGKRMEASHKRILKAIEKEIEWVENRLDIAVQKESAWSHKRDLLLSVPGVGRTMVYTLLADFPELGTLNNKEAAALTGLAPINRDSGKLKGKRRIYGGRGAIRKTMYMAMLSAIQCNNILKNFYHALVAKGKHKKVAIVACMRKLITMLNAMVRDDVAWAY
ncbi:IS110 family transposase [Halioxenophilus sp. WMMB6]|uniref:IS110 family transposase n=1 Tax=Halioxenophilus sp. WMMB6 TaxID=3073815 RepID=UPI00295E9015|nr:IS110 family transposase [Halioxenophilus sp. WMMB6]